jgi:hypothetical protein
VPRFELHLHDEVSVVRQANDTHYLGFIKDRWGYFETKDAVKKVSETHKNQSHGLVTPINNRIPVAAAKKEKEKCQFNC